jgi:hypothetical protein
MYLSCDISYCYDKAHEQENSTKKAKNEIKMCAQSKFCKVFPICVYERDSK